MHIAIVGFPKCGTSALARELASDDGVELLKAPNGSIEVPPKVLQALKPNLDSDRIAVHKYAADIFDLQALLGVANPDLIVVCYRDPARVLVSWQNMHRQIALAVSQPEHFAFRERDFYSDCSIEDYYSRFAKSKLEYDRYIEYVLKLVPSEKLVFVDQSAMALDTPGVANVLLRCVRSGTRPNMGWGDLDRESKPRLGYADKQDAALPQEIADELSAVANRLAEVMLESGALIVQ